MKKTLIIMAAAATFAFGLLGLPETAAAAGDPVVVDKVELTVEAPKCGDPLFADGKYNMKWTITDESNSVVTVAEEEGMHFPGWLDESFMYLEEGSFACGSDVYPLFQVESRPGFIYSEEGTTFYVNGKEVEEVWVCEAEDPGDPDSTWYAWIVGRAVSVTHGELSAVKAKAATYTEDGYIAHYTCDTCGQLYGDAEGKKKMTKAHVKIPAMGHRWDGGVVREPATFEKTGVRLFTCMNDPSHTRTEVIPKLTEPTSESGTKETTQPIEPAQTEEPDDVTSTSGQDRESSKNGNGSGKDSGAGTGDRAPIAVIAVLLLASLIAAAVVMIRRRNRGDKE